MPLIKIDRFDTFKYFLQEIIINKEKILEEYNTNKSKFHIYETKNCLGWWITIPYRFGFVEGSKYLPTLSKIISSVENVMTTVMISDVKSNLPQGVHAEDIPNGIRRFHIPIKHNPNAKLNVFENNNWNSYEWEENSAFEFINYQDQHYISCDGNYGNRIIVMVDIFDYNINDNQLASVKKWYDEWEKTAEFYKVDLFENDQ